MRRMMSSDNYFRVGVLGVIVCLGLGSQAVAQVGVFPAPASAAKPGLPRSMDAEPSSTLAIFGDWMLRCQRLGNGTNTQRVCEVAQQIGAQGEQTLVGQLAIGRLNKADSLRLSVSLPVNVTLSNPPIFSIDGGVSEPLDLGWRKCLPGGCIADAPLKDDVLRRWKTEAAAGRIIWTDAAGRNLAVGISFRGLTQALDALSKEP